MSLRRWCKTHYKMTTALLLHKPPKALKHQMERLSAATPMETAAISPPRQEAGLLLESVMEDPQHHVHKTHTTFTSTHGPRLSTMQSGQRTANVSASHRLGPREWATYSKPNTEAPADIDNHADAHCMGANFAPLYFTGYTCDVAPFSSEHKSMKDVKIGSGATACDDPITGKTYILVLHQASWFGERLSNSLINPNQCRAYGISLCDDPCDPHRKLGSHDPQTDTFIPFNYQNSIVGLETRSPT